MPASCSRSSCSNKVLRHSDVRCTTILSIHSLIHRHPHKWVVNTVYTRCSQRQRTIYLLQIIHHLNTFGWMSSEPAEWIEWFAWMPEHFRVRFHSFHFIFFYLFSSILFFIFSVRHWSRKRRIRSVEESKKNGMKTPLTEERTPKSPLYRRWKHEMYEHASERASKKREKNVCLKYADSKVMQVLIQFIACAKSKEFILCVCVRVRVERHIHFFPSAFRHDVLNAGAAHNL